LQRAEWLALLLCDTLHRRGTLAQRAHMRSSWRAMGCSPGYSVCCSRWIRKSDSHMSMLEKTPVGKLRCSPSPPQSHVSGITEWGANGTI
jgi:hypothetical protein